MRSRAARFLIALTALLAVAATAVFIIQTEKQITAVSSSLRQFDVRAREAADALAEMRAAQQAYVAEGQGIAFWMPKVSTTMATATSAIDRLSQTATDAGTRAALDEAAMSMAEFKDIDTRAREYVNGEQPLMASDVIFTEGGLAATAVAHQVETARLTEQQAVDRREALSRKQEAVALASAGIFVALAVLLPVAVQRPAREETAGNGPVLGLVSPPAAPTTAATIASHTGLLKAAAELSTEFGRVHTIDDVNVLLGRAAKAMDASGVVVWMGSLGGADLEPVLSHGYSAQTLARIAPVPRSAANAAAAAYRSGNLQIVLSRPGTSGAIVAPILVPGGCVGALSAEFSGAETSESVQSLAAVVAANLASVLSPAPAEAEPPQIRAVSAS